MTVYVYGPPEDVMPDDGSLCSEKRDTLVVYHVKCVQLTTGGWACVECGFASKETEGE